MFTKTLIFLVCVVGLFVVMFAMIDSRFFTAAYQSTIGTAPVSYEILTAANVTVYSQAGTDNMTYQYSSYWNYHNGSKMFPIRGLTDEYVEVWWGQGPYFTRNLQFRHIKKVWWGLRNQDFMYFSTAGTRLDYTLIKQDIVNLYDSSINGTALEASCAHTAVSCVFEYNMSKYADIGVAWDAGELAYTMSYELHYNASKLTAFNILGELINFSSPNLGVPGPMGTLFNMGIGLLFMVIIAIAVFKILQSIIPWIKGVDD